MGTPLCEDPLDSRPLSSTDPTPDPPSYLPMILTLVGPLLSGKVFAPLVILILFTLVIIVYLHPLDHPGWRQAMVVEMQALEQSGSWELVSLPLGKKAVGCRWLDLTTQLIALKPSWLPKDILRYMVLIMEILFLLWQKSLLSAFYLQWLLFVTDHFIN
ncbi:hypothetical protein CR513_50990, partial [Mucuna pruriens]